MKYINAAEILPQDLIEQIQRFVEGGCLYIPMAKEKKAWGTNTGIRKELKQRNHQIYRQHAAGIRVTELAQRYCLSPSSIYKIIRNEMRNEL